jgi:selenide,water dikinase
LPPSAHPWIDERTGLLDDAAVVRPEPARSLVLTMDVVTPIVDDPRTFGAIAAANSLSDVYAMGGRPEVAMCLLGCPSDVLGLEVVEQILLGVHEVCRQARTAIVGGHTMKDSEPKCGLAVVGSVEPDRVWSQRFAEPGDLLVLTKAIGTGIVGQAVRSGTVSPELVEAAVQRMTQLNDVACELGRRFGVHACTDITGFGLLGHLRNVVEAAGVSVTLQASAVPRLPGVLELIAARCIPGGTLKNLAYAANVTRYADAVPQNERLLFADAQTSGGLLLALPSPSASELVRALLDAGIGDARVIGAIERRGEPEICVVA